MIDFRYHVVSIIAVFLALATGLVLGASLLNTPLIKGLDSANDALIADKEDLRDQVIDLERQRDVLADSVAAISPFALFDELAGQQVVVVRLPGSNDAIASDLSEAVAEAGGEVTGVVSVRDEWTAPTDAVVLNELVAQLTQPGVDFVPGDDEYGRAATLLANALVAEVDPADTAGGRPPETGSLPPGNTGVDEEGRGTILEGLSIGGFLDADPGIGLADVSIVVGPPAPASPDDRTPTVNEAWADIAAALDEVGRAVVLVGPGTAAESDGLVAAVRSDDSAAASVSTVDSVDEPIGPAVTVLALSRQLAGINGHYGQVDAADGPVPLFAPPIEG